MATQLYRPPHDFGVGGMTIGNEFQFATDEQAERRLRPPGTQGCAISMRRPGTALALALALPSGGSWHVSRAFANSSNTPHFDYSADDRSRTACNSSGSTGWTSCSSTTCRPTTSGCHRIGKRCSRSRSDVHLPRLRSNDAIEAVAIRVDGDAIAAGHGREIEDIDRHWRREVEALLGQADGLDRTAAE